MQIRAYKASEFVRDCQTSSGFSFCLGFITGALQGIQFLENIEPDGGNRCNPTDIDPDLVVKTFVPYANAHPELLNGPAAVVLRLALLKSYPAAIPCVMKPQTQPQSR